MFNVPLDKELEFYIEELFNTSLIVNSPYRMRPKSHWS